MTPRLDQCLLHCDIFEVSVRSTSYGIYGVLRDVSLLAAHGQYSYHQAWSSILTDMPASLPGVETQYWFPEHSDLLFPAGELVQPFPLLCDCPRQSLQRSIA